MNESFNALIDSASGILVLLPDALNFDTVAAGLGLYLSLQERKQIAISCKSPITVGFNRLIGVNKIENSLGNKNLIIKFKNYDPKNVEKVSWDIVNDEFYLTLVSKAGQIAPQVENVDFKYSGVSADLVILIGGSNDTDFSAVRENQIAGAKIIHVGTKFLNLNNIETLSFARPASSVSELIADIIRQSSFPIDIDIATNLAMGIEDGSSSFSSPEVTPETFEIFAYLLRNGAKRLPKFKINASDFPAGSIPDSSYFSKPQDVEGTNEKEQEINPPEDWLQPKVIKGASSNLNPQIPSENKG